MECIIKPSDFPNICRTCLSSKAQLSPLENFDFVQALRLDVQIDVPYNEVPTQICQDCVNIAQEFLNFKRKCEHSKQILLEALQQSVHSIEDEAPRSEQKDETTTTCNICSKEIRILGLPAHLRRHNQPKKHKCSQCDKQFREPNELAKHRRRVHHIFESVNCNVCDQVFQIQAQLDFHLKRHFKKKSVCDICGKTYYNSAKLKRHQQVHEDRSKTIYCLKCDQVFAREASLKNHQKVYHSGQPIVKNICTICGKAVLNLKMHTTLRHSDDRPHKCDKCEKSFALSYQLIKHGKKHENVEKRYNALCNICGKGCESTSALNLHMATHTDALLYECVECEKKFKSITGYRAHKRTHLNLRPYVCSYCPKGFTTRQILKAHLRTHTGEKPYSCELCLKRFSQKGSLVTHMKTHGV